MAKNWYTYYQKNLKTNITNILLHWPYLLKIIFLRPGKILEIGCGPASHSVFIKKILTGTKIHLLDNDKNIMRFLEKSYGKKFNRHYCDILNPDQISKLGFKKNQFDLIYSQGLMEHFEKKDFIKIIRHFLPFSKKLIFSIPSDTYPNRDFGNEILRSKKEIESIIKRVKNIKYQVRPYFPDIGLRIKLIKLKKDKMNLLESFRFILFGSCHLLIEVKNNN